MKFLLEFVSCCGCATTTAANNGSVNGSESGPSANSPRSEETRLLGNYPRRYRQRKCGRMGTSGGGEWRPSLGSIDEDHVVMMERRRKSEAERTVKRKGSFVGGSDDRGRDRRFSNDSGTLPYPVIPAFSATPFIF